MSCEGTGGVSSPSSSSAMPVPLVSSSPPPLDRVDDLSFGDDISLPYDEDFPQLSPETEDIRTELPTITIKEPLNEFSDTRQNNEFECKVEPKSELNDKENELGRISPNKFVVMEDSNVEDLDLKYNDADEVIIESPSPKDDCYDLDFEDFTTFTTAPIATHANLLTVDKADDFPNSDTVSEIKTQETSSPDNISFTNEIDIEWETDLKLSDLKSEIALDTPESPPNFDADFPKTELGETLGDKWPVLDSEYSVRSETAVDVNDNKMKILSGESTIASLENENFEPNLNELKVNLEDEDDFDNFTFHKPESENLNPLESEYKLDDHGTDLTFSKSDLNISNSQESSPHHAASEQDLETDDFVFQKSESSVQESQKSSPLNVDKSGQSSFDDFDDFASFQTTEASIPQPSLFASDFQPFESKPGEEREDDDFGDFETADENNFTPAQTSCDKQSDNDIKILLSQKESDILELISKAVEDMFVEEVDDSEECSTNLQMKLGSAWKALSVEHTIFQWNESASQKKLLAALGIDSRNILFGSKWNPNMPRFAANLGASPLQPVKQSPSTHNEISRDEELPTSTSVETIASESFADQQPSSYAESLLLDLENLMSTLDQMTSGHPHHFKISDLFTNACNDRVNSEEFKSPTMVARKINLPDTHIFTPENCETPWSHTIHYDAHTYCNAALNNETAISAEPNPEKDITFEEDITAPVPSSTAVEIPEPDLDDFGDFHSSEVVQPVKTETILLPSKITETVTATPTIQWPNPGNIDVMIFDEFASAEVPSETQWFDSKSVMKNNVPIPINTNSFINDIPKPNPVQFVLKETKIVSDLTEKSRDEDNDFSEFKSAGLKSFPAFDDFNDFQSAPYQSPSSSNLPLPKNSFLQPKNTLLQPVVSNKTVDKPTGSYQILQPLSLESFSQINWPDPGVALPELSNFNPVNSIQTYSEPKAEKAKPSYNPSEDDWSDFMSIKPSNSPKKENKANNDEDDWTDFIGSAEQPSNRIELKTISQNIHSQNYATNNVMSIPNLAYSNPRNNNVRTSGKHLQNL